MKTTIETIVLWAILIMLITLLILRLWGIAE